MICTKIQSPLNLANNRQRTISVFIHVAEEDKTYAYNIGEDSNILKSLTNFVIFLMIQINLKIEYDFSLINVINEDDTEQLTSDSEFLKCLQFIKESEELGLHLLLFGAYLNDNVISTKTTSDLSLQNMRKSSNDNKAIAKAPDTNLWINPLYFANKSEQITFRKPISLKTKKHTAVQDVGLQYEDQDIEITGLKNIEMTEEFNTENSTNQVKTTVQTTVQRTHLTVQSTMCGPNNLVINLEENDNNSYTNKKLQIQSTEYGRNNLCIHIDEKNSADVVTIPGADRSSESMKSMKEENKPIQHQKTLPKTIEKRTNLLNHKFDETCECCHIDITNCDIDYEGNRPIKRRLSDDSIQLRSSVTRKRSRKLCRKRSCKIIAFQSVYSYSGAPSSDVPCLSYATTSSNPKTHKQAKGGRRKFSGVRFQQRKRK